METLRYLSVCSGIEAASVAWHPLGWEAAGFAEIEPFPAHVLHHRFRAGRPMFMPDPDRVHDEKERRTRATAIRSVARIPEHGAVPNFGDLNQFHRWPDAAFDVLVGGTPCQSFSVAGLRQGLRDPRGNLALVYLALADRYRPRWLVWENVPGVLSSHEGRDFGAFLGGMAQLGYGFAWRVLDAQFVRTCRFGRAVPQRRRRVFVVGHSRGWRAAAAVLFDRESLRGDPPPRRPAGQRPAPTLAARTRGGGGLGTDFDLDGGLITMAHGQGNAEIGIDHGPTLTCNHEAPIVARNLRGEGFDASEDGTGRGTPVQTSAFAFDLRGREGGAMPEGPHDTANIRAASGGSSRSYVAQAVAPIAFDAQAGGNTGLATGDVAGALHGGGKHGGRAAVALPWAVRRLTPRECERLQGFPDDWTLVPVGNRPAANGPRYKALGNSMAVNVMEWIGARIAMVEGIERGPR